MKITCRVCKIQQGEFFTLDSTVPISDQSQHKLLDIFNKCFQLNATLQDALPQVVCLSCLEKLTDFFEFQVKAAKTDFELRNFIEHLHDNEVKQVDLESYIDPNAICAETSAVMVKKTVIEEAVSTEDEFQEDYEGAEITQERNEQEIEDTDILFELYNKNDCCIENLKFDKNENTNAIEEHSSRANEYISKSAKSNKLLENPSFEKFDTTIESCIPSIEISRIQLSVPCPQIRTLTLEPLIEIRKWQCFDCGRKYLTEEKLSQHKKLHNQSKDCRCKICGSRLSSLYQYRKHMKEHGTERQFSCEFCDKTFSTRANLKAHLYIHTNLRPFKCEVCGKTFQQKSILKTHMTLHTGKPFECTLCQRRFSRTAHLNIHMRQHNNIRPYQCSQCSSSYMQKSHLDRHVSSSHLGVRFQCTVCGKMYTKKPSLNTHMREAHCTTVSMYNCKICDLDFTKQKALYYHVKSKHPDYKTTS